MKLYPFTAPIILDDSIFTAYGGLTGTSTPFMRSASYLIAEHQTSDYIGTLLLPTTLTGTSEYFPGRGPIVTDYGYVTELGPVRARDTQGNIVFTITGTNSYAYVREDTYGYILVAADTVHSCFPHGAAYWPVKFEYTYVAGLPTGTANQPGMLIAMTKAAQLVLNEMYEVTANESTGDAGVTEFTILRDYSEKRKAWKNTIFGQSPAAAWIARMIDGTVKKARRALMFGGL